MNISNAVPSPITPVTGNAANFGALPDYHQLAAGLNQGDHHNFLDPAIPAVNQGLSTHLAQYESRLQTLPPEVQQKIADSELGSLFLEALENAKQGSINSNDILNIQAFVQSLGINIGSEENVSGIDGLFGPQTYQGLNEAFESLTTNPEQAFQQLESQTPWIQQEVSHVQSHASARMDPNAISFGQPSLSTGSPSPVSRLNEAPSNAAGSIDQTSGLQDTGRRDIQGRPIQLTPEAAGGFETVLDIDRKKGVRVEVFSSFRSVQKQQQLFDQAIRKYGSPEAARKWVAPPGKSRHNFGNAIDMNMFRNGKKIPQAEFDQIIAQAGMYRPMSYETWHIEPLSTRASRGQA